MVLSIAQIGFLWSISAAYLRSVVKSIGEHQKTTIDKINTVQKEISKKSGVTDPFKAANRTNSVGSATNHIIPRNSPDHIRNQNAEDIKAGLGSYGDPE